MKCLLRGMVAAILVCIPFLAACSDGKDAGRGSAGAEVENITGKPAGDAGKAGETMKSKPDGILRTARGGGKWFPGDGNQLRPMVSGFIRKAEVPEVKGRIVAAIAPHAGYIYSGGVAGYTFRAIQNNASGGKPPETVVVLGFNHRRGFRGVAFMDGDALVTPMGEVRLDMEATSFLATSSKRLIIDYSLHGEEHSAENEIPFVQAALPDARIAVGLFGDHDPQTLSDLVSALSALAKKKRILVGRSFPSEISCTYPREDRAALSINIGREEIYHYL